MASKHIGLQSFAPSSIPLELSPEVECTRLLLAGQCDRRIFGLKPGERVHRQIEADRRLRSKQGKPDLGLAVDASAVLDEAALQWLFSHPHELLLSASGTPLAVAAPPHELHVARETLVRGGKGTRAGGRHFIRKLRRTVEMLAVSLDEAEVKSTERQLFANVYKGVTDLVTKYVWPDPAFVVTRCCAQFGVTPNMVTAVGILLMFAATWLFHDGAFGWGLAAAWAMTFLDTVDGKLARVTGLSSRLGNLLDHGTDILHPPLWWWAVTVGLNGLSETQAPLLWLSFWVVAATYIASRVLEELFKSRFGFNAFIWQPFDSRFRMIISRRNTILLILTAGLLLGTLEQSWMAAAAWSVISVVIQAARFWVAERQSKAQPLRPWLA